MPINEWIVTGPGGAYHRFEDEIRAVTQAAQLAHMYCGPSGQGKPAEIRFPDGRVVRFTAERVS